MRDINNVIYKINEYVMINYFIKKVLNKKKKIIKFLIKIHLIDDFKINVFINIDIIKSQ